MTAKTIVLTTAALVGFASNSLLCRAALSDGAIDAASFTLVRLASGAVVLAVLARSWRRAADGASDGSWTAAAALFGYAIAFSLAYLRLDAGAGALILFGCVQLTMFAWGLRRGERLRPVQWIGFFAAVGGLVALNLPGLKAPDPIGALLMASAGVAWGVYSLLGRGCQRPLAATASNFARGVPFALAAAGAAMTFSRPHAELRGLVLAATSGALASGVGYSLWYAALRELSATRAAIVQLSVPVLTASGAALVLGEPPSARTVGAGATILAGVALALAFRAQAVPRQTLE
jgi:drug/metabolite transporter (DMT)-like permease